MNINIVEKTDFSNLEKNIFMYVKKLNEIKEEDRSHQINNAIKCIYNFSDGILEKYLNILIEKKIIN